jgi:hypothetical protein
VRRDIACGDTLKPLALANNDWSLDIGFMVTHSNNSQKSDLVHFRDEARQRFAEDRFDDAGIANAYTLVTERWSNATTEEAKILADIMAATPSSAWMNEYLLPAKRGDIPHADILSCRFEEIASAFAEGVAREDGLTTRA